MKTLEEIQKITKDKIKADKKAAREAEKKRLAEEKKRRENKIKYYKEDAIDFFIKEIEEAAREGKNSYEINLSGNLKRDADVRLEVKYIKKRLKDFNPTFTEEETYSYETNWEGGEIDGTRRYYTVTHVRFDW